MKRGLMALALCLLSSCNQKSEEQQSADVLKIKVSSKMKDPESTEFRDLKFGSGMLCGEFNAKNSFGAYIGYDKFSAIASIVQMRSDIASVDEALHGGPKIIDGRSVLEEFDLRWSECQAKGVVVV